MMFFDRTLSKLVTQLADKYDLPEHRVKEAIDNFFRNVKKLMESPSMPKIMIHNLGTFKTSVRKFNKELQYLDIRRKCGKISQHLYEQLKSYVWAVKARLLLEQPHKKYHKFVISQENLTEKMLNDYKKVNITLPSHSERRRQEAERLKKERGEDPDN